MASKPKTAPKEVASGRVNLTPLFMYLFGRIEGRKHAENIIKALKSPEFKDTDFVALAEKYNSGIEADKAEVAKLKAQIDESGNTA